MTPVGTHSSAVAVRMLGAELIDLFAAGVVTVSVDASRCTLGPAGCQVLVDAARYARQSKGCVAVSGLRPADRLSLVCHDVGRQVDVFWDRGG